MRPARFSGMVRFILVTAIWKQRLRCGLIGLAVLGGLYVVLVLLTPTFGSVVGYADEQPRLRVVQPENASSAEELARIHRMAKVVFDGRPELGSLYWPEPSAIYERPDCWLVQFTSKVPVYRFLGFKQVVPPSDRSMSLTIDKEDHRVRVGNWCH